MKETGVKIHVPPISINRDEITVTGDKEGVQMAIEKIKQIYTKMVCVIISKMSVICIFIVININMLCNIFSHNIDHVKH